MWNRLASTVLIFAVFSVATKANTECEPGWTPASWTTYTSYAPCCEDSPNYDPDYDDTECVQYSACKYTGLFAYLDGKQPFEWVKNNDIIAFFTNMSKKVFANKKMRVSGEDINGNIVEVEVLVADTCGDDDCGGCCTTNAKPSGHLVDMEYWTVVNNFGGINAARGQICWQLVADTPTAPTSAPPISTPTGGFCNWGAEGDAASSICKGGAQGGYFCNENKNNCEQDCAGKWCDACLGWCSNKQKKLWRVKCKAKFSHKCGACEECEPWKFPCSKRKCKKMNKGWSEKCNLNKGIGCSQCSAV